MTKQIPIVSYGTDAVFTLRLRWSERRVAVHDGPNVSYQHQPSEPLDMSLVTNVSVTLRREMCRKSVVPPYKIEGQMLRVELPASLQEVGDWQAHIVCNVVDTTLEDGIMQYSVSVPICSVVRSDQLLSDQPVQHVDVDVWAMLKGAPGDKGEPLRYEDLTEEQIRSLKGDPGDPTELLDELSRQQSARLDEIATAQRESLTSIGARLSDEQRTALEELAGRLSREQAQTLERQGQERAKAQAGALQALDQEVNRKYDDALGGIGGKVSEAVEAQMPNQLSESLPNIIGLDDHSRLTVGGRPIGESLKGAPGRDGAEVRLDQGWIRPLVYNMRHSPLRGKSNIIPSMDEMQAGVLANPDYLPELWSNSETLYVSFYTNRHRAQHFYWDGLRAYNDGTSGRRSIMRIDVSGLQGQHIRLVWTEAQMAKIHELIFNSSGTRSIYVDITDVDDRLHFLTTPAAGGVGGVSMVAIYESLASDNPQLPRGTWAQRPKTPYIGQQYIATDMRRNGVGDLPMWYNGQMWIDYEGHDVTRRYLAEE